MSLTPGLSMGSSNQLASGETILQAVSSKDSSDETKESTTHGSGSSGCQSLTQGNDPKDSGLPFPGTQSWQVLSSHIRNGAHLLSTKHTPGISLNAQLNHSKRIQAPLPNVRERKVTAPTRELKEWGWRSGSSGRAPT
jgi:hypothetical protein